MMRSLLLILLFVTAVSAIETFMMRRYNPFQSPLGYNGLSVTGGADKKMISNRRKANKIVDANMEKAKAKEISVRKKTKKQWGVAKNEKGVQVKRKIPEFFGTDEMEALFLYTVD